ncbi:MAG: hypothetical protein O2960_26895 [Verrucomicrobia bacterium]|nr:hypothetical protein [Verrucomicrobiota bacterium]
MKRIFHSAWLEFVGRLVAVARIHRMGTTGTAIGYDLFDALKHFV